MFDSAMYSKPNTEGVRNDGKTIDTIYILWKKKQIARKKNSCLSNRIYNSSGG